MEAEIVLNLLDSYWYDLNFFKRSSIPIKTNDIPEIPSSNPDIPTTLPTIHTKTKSPPQLEKMSSSSKLSCSSASPNSVLPTPKLQTIFSGKETRDFEDLKPEKSAPEHETTPTKVNHSSNSNSNSSSPKKGIMGIMKRRKKRGLSKSLSDLEFEELKGFMDLGFVFSEQDKDSILASIIPGLQRLGNNSKHTDSCSNNNNAVVDEKIATKSGVANKSAGAAVSRPYLSEAWEVFERKKKENSLLNWKVPAATSQTDMKGYLKFWAHSVASTVK